MPLAMAFQAQVPGSLHVLVATVLERGQGELPDLDPLNQFPHIDERAAAVSTQPEPRPPGHQLASAVVPGIDPMR